jgi:REP element-mobilizing transposase RayT
MPALLSRWLGPERERPSTPAFFVTWRLGRAQPVLTPPERDLVCSVLRHGHGERYTLVAYVVMDNHVHVLVRATGPPIDRLLHSWQSLTTHELQRVSRRSGRVWQEGAVTTVLRTEDALRVKTEYVVGNPWKRWPFLKRYPWVWEAGEDTRARA